LKPVILFQLASTENGDIASVKNSS